MTTPSRAGFTLLEVMIAVAVLGLIGGLTWKSFDAASDLKSRIERAEERDQTVRGAMNRIAREVSMAFLSEHYDTKRFRERPTRFVIKDGAGRRTSPSLPSPTSGSPSTPRKAIRRCSSTSSGPIPT